MKFLKILFVLFVAVSLVSCSSDNDGVDPLLDTDGDGVVDIDDLCPKIGGGGVFLPFFLYIFMNFKYIFTATAKIFSVNKEFKSNFILHTFPLSNVSSSYQILW